MATSRGERFLSHLTRSFRGLIILAFLAGCLVLPSRVSRAQTEDLEAQRRQIQQQQATIASQIDTLKATDAEIAIALAKLRENVVAQQARVELAQQASEVADRQVVASEQAVAATQADLDDLSAKLSKQAVGLYVRPQTDQVLSTFIPAKADSGSGELDSLEDRTRIRLHLDDVANLVAEVRVKKSDLQRAEAEAKRERTQAEKVRRSTEDALVELQHGLAQQNELAVAVAARIEQSKAEADKLSVQDSKLAAEIRSRQEELAARLAEERRLAAVAAAAVTADAARRSAVLEIGRAHV